MGGKHSRQSELRRRRHRREERHKELVKEAKLAAEKKRMRATS